MYSVTDTLYRGSRPNSVDIGILGYCGFERIICLENDIKQINAEKLMCKEIGIEFISDSYSEITSPTANHLRNTVYLLQSSKKTFVHCRRGIDRTGYVIASYRMLVQKWSFDRAFQECEDYGHRGWFYFWWKKSLKKLRIA